MVVGALGCMNNEDFEKKNYILLNVYIYIYIYISLYVYYLSEITNVWRDTLINLLHKIGKEHNKLILI